MLAALLSVAQAHEVQLSKVAWEGWRAHPGRRAMQGARVGLGFGGWVQAARGASADAGRKVKTMRVRPQRHPHPQAGEAARSESSEELFKMFGINFQKNDGRTFQHKFGRTC